jgi:hypothetical protein
LLCELAEPGGQGDAAYFFGSFFITVFAVVQGGDEGIEGFDLIVMATHDIYVMARGPI